MRRPVLAATIATLITTSIVIDSRALAQPKPAKPAPGEACSLLTKEDAAAALGETVKGPDFKSGLPGIEPGTTASYCEYEGSGLHKIHLNLMHLKPATATMYREICAKKTKDGLAGLGDMACWYNDKHEELQMLKGTTLVTIEINTKGNPTEPIKAAMKKALAKLH